MSEPIRNIYIPKNFISFFHHLVHYTHFAYKNAHSRLDLLSTHLSSGLSLTCVCTRTNWEAHTTLTEALNTPLLRPSLLINFL